MARHVGVQTHIARERRRDVAYVGGVHEGAVREYVACSVEMRERMCSGEMVQCTDGVMRQCMWRSAYL
jgi:hypothetical protein